MWKCLISFVCCYECLLPFSPHLIYCILAHPYVTHKLADFPTRMFTLAVNLIGNMLLLIYFGFNAFFSVCAFTFLHFGFKLVLAADWKTIFFFFRFRRMLFWKLKEFLFKFEPINGTGCVNILYALALVRCSLSLFAFLWKLGQKSGIERHSGADIFAY